MTLSEYRKEEAKADAISDKIHDENEYVNELKAEMKKIADTITILEDINIDYEDLQVDLNGCVEKLSEYYDTIDMQLYDTVGERKYKQLIKEI